MSDFEFDNIDWENGSAKYLTNISIKRHWTVEDMVLLNDAEVPVEVSGDAIATMTRKVS